MKQIEILKAKVDFQKTWFATTLTATIASQIAYWSTSAKDIFKLTTACFGIACIIFLFEYHSRHRILIDELRK